MYKPNWTRLKKITNNMSYYYVSAKLLPYLPHKYKHPTTDQKYILHRKNLITL